MANKIFNISHQLQVFEAEIQRLEDKILRLQKQLDDTVEQNKNHLIRIKNGESVSDDFILYGRRYQDLSPEKAHRLYSNKDFNFILLDVSEASFRSKPRLPEALHISLEELPERFMELQSRTIPILVISEDGARSILACEFLAKRGFYNCNNVSGGYKYWPAFQFRDLREA